MAAKTQLYALRISTTFKGGGRGRDTVFCWKKRTAELKAIDTIAYYLRKECSAAQQLPPETKSLAKAQKYLRAARGKSDPTSDVAYIHIAVVTIIPI